MKIIKNLIGLSLLTGIATLANGQETTQRSMFDEGNRRIDSVRLTTPDMRPPLPVSTLRSEPPMMRESVRYTERSVPNERVDERRFFRDEARVFGSRRPEERASRSYIISGDRELSLEQPVTVYARPEPVERVIYGEPVYKKVRPEVIVQREVEYVPVPEHYVEFPRRNSDSRRIVDGAEYETMPERYVESPRRDLENRRMFDEVEYESMPDRYVEVVRRDFDNRRMTDEYPLSASAPVRRIESRVVVPQYEILPELPRFYRERELGAGNQISTRLPVSTGHDRRYFDERLSTPTRYDYSRMPQDLEPVRYVRERIVTSEIRDPAYEYRSTMPSSRRFAPTYEVYRDPRSGSMLRETDLPRSYYGPDVTTERQRFFIEDGQMREIEMRAPMREQDFRNTLPPTRDDGPPYYYNSIGDEYLKPEDRSGYPVEFKLAQYHPQSDPYTQPGDRDLRQMQYYGRPEDLEFPVEANRAPGALQPQGYVRPKMVKYPAPVDNVDNYYVQAVYRNNTLSDDRNYPLMDERNVAPARSYTLPAVSQVALQRGDLRTLPAQAAAPTYVAPVEVERQYVQPKTYLPEEVHSEVSTPSYIAPAERQYLQTQPQTSLPENVRSEISAPTHIAPTYIAPTQRPTMERPTMEPHNIEPQNMVPQNMVPQNVVPQNVVRQYVQPQASLPETVRTVAPTRVAPVPVYIRPEERQPMQAQSSPRDLDLRTAQAPTEPFRLEENNSTINRLPDQGQRRTYVAPEIIPMTARSQMEPQVRQPSSVDREIRTQPLVIPAVESTTFGRTSVTPTRTTVVERLPVESFPRQPSNQNREILAQPRAIIATPTPTFSQPPRAQVARAPLPRQTAERIQGFPSPVDSGFNRDAYNRALEGMSAIALQLRPELMVDFGYENDTDGFEGTHIGGRYNHFSRAGNLYYLGLSFDNFSEEGAVPIDSVSARSLLLGSSGYLNEKLRGFADLSLTDFSEGPDLSFSATAGGSYNFDGVNTLTASYSRFDFFREAKTVRSLLQDITADRFRLDWTSNPIEKAEGRPFGERVYFEGSAAFTNLSDSNSSLAYSLRPYYRVADDPNIDVSVGWSGLSYANQSLFYYSPDNLSGPNLGARISGETLWNLLYDVRAFVSFPTQDNSSRSLQASLRKNFTDHFSAGANLFGTEAPRAGNSSYRFGSIFFDLRYKF
jgi:hypothetical protein